MRKVILVSSALLIVAALVFAGGDPWKAKPYQQWDDKDVKKILEDSPWAKVIQVDVNWKASKDNGADMGGPAATNQPAPAGTNQPMATGGKTMGGSPATPALARPSRDMETPGVRPDRPPFSSAGYHRGPSKRLCSANPNLPAR